MAEKILYRLENLERPASLTIPEIQRIVEEGIDRQTQGVSLAGKKIGILAGSRGIRHIDVIIKQVVDSLKSRSAQVVILPAMGSHGGATAEGQSALLAHYGITEEKVGAPVVSAMAAERVGDIDGHPVFVDRNALGLDGIVPVNRIKPHTDFHGPHESGIVKMLVIGLGKRAQAEAVHRHGVKGLRDLIPQVAKVVLDHVPLLAAVAIVENKYDETTVVEVLARENLFERDRELLALSRQLLPQIPFENLDVLVAAEMGKNISGVGIDPNVTKRMRMADYPDEPGGPRRIVVLDLTEPSEGNALGIGIADVMTKRLYDKVDFEKTYINTITAMFLERCFVPVVMPTDERAVQVAIGTCGRPTDWQDVRMVFIRNTLALQEMYVSPALLKELPAGYVQSAKPVEAFTASGELAIRWQEV